MLARSVSLRVSITAIALVIPMTLLAVDPRQANSSAPAPSQSASGRDRLDTSAIRTTLDQYCVSCHNQRLKTAGLALDTLDLAHLPADAEAWEKVVQKLRLQTMPPLGARRPEQQAYDRTIAALEGLLDRAAAGHPDPGRPMLHRLNRAEYANAVRDLLGIDVDVTSLLPPDDAAFGFDNVADALGSSPALLQAYLAAARKISAVAVGDPRGGPVGKTYSARQDLSQDQHLEGMPLGTFGGVLGQHIFPADGEYEVQVRLYRTNLNAIHGLEEPHELELTIDGERVLMATVGGADDLEALQKNPTSTSDSIEAARLRTRRFINAGQRTVRAAFLESAPVVLRTNRLQRYIRDFDNPFDAEGAPHVQSITIQGPFNPKPSAIAPASRLFVCRPSSPTADRPCATRILSTVARRAYRRSPTAGELHELMSFYEREGSSGSFDTGIELALRWLLASPSFVFRVEKETPDTPPGQPYLVAPEELASRLSFFLWSSIPDDELLALSASRRLNQPRVLAEQVRRMLADPRADALVANFSGQWLQLRNLRGIVPNPDVFPDFDDNLRQAFRREAELFFASIVREDRNVVDLLTADYTFLNERLAKHYGVPNVFGSHFRRVSLTDERRKGLLGKGAVLLVTSHANTTSPVLRGKWILDNLLGAPPPPPPPDVPALQESEPGSAPRTMREQMEQHRANPACAACHRLMDPFGFALESFDVVGAWRTTNEAGAPLNTADVLADGSAVDGAVALRQALVKRSNVFVQTLTKKLMTYALGRGLTYTDMPEVRKIVREGERQDYRFSAIVLGIVNSVPFQMRMRASAVSASGSIATAGRP
jgi:mono/diheme cytochrome c family protein